MFHFKQFSITHQSEGLKVNTDGCLLGALADYYRPLNCLDIGTGTGVIALMLAQKFPLANITAVELNPIAFEQAFLNIQGAKFSSRMELIHTDVLLFKPDHKFDLIVCNPPYFKKHLQGPDSNKNMALHNDTLPQDLLIEKVCELLTDEGLFMVIYPPYEMQLLETIAAKNQLHVMCQFIIENKKGNHYRSIVGFTKVKMPFVADTIVLMNKEGKRTKQYSEIMESFYL